MGERQEPISEKRPDAAGEEAVLRRFVAAREAGDIEAMRAATAEFVHGRYGQLLALARLKLPTEQDVEDVVGETILSALDSLGPDRAGFDGRAPGELGAWLIKILKRRIADHFRREERRLKADSLDIEPDDRDGGGGSRRIEPIALTGDPAAEVPIRDAHERVVAQLSETHAEVIRLWWNERLPASEIVDRLHEADSSGVGTTMTVDNVHQITSRFRAKMREALEMETEGR